MHEIRNDLYHKSVECKKRRKKLDFHFKEIKTNKKDTDFWKKFFFYKIKLE